MNRAASLSRARDRIAAAPPWQTFLLVFIPILGLYLLTMARSNLYTNVDSLAAGLPAWRFAQFGDLDLSQFDGFKFIDQIGGRVLSNRAPGIAYISVPAFWVFGEPTFTGAAPSQLPATATAAVLSAGAVGTLHLVFRRVVSPLPAVGAALVFGVATSTWAISSVTLWPHGPGQFFLALALLGMACSRFLAAGVAFAATLLIRPVTAVMAAVAGLVASWKTKSWRPALMVAGGSSIGLALLLLYNGLVLGAWTPTPESYGAGFLARAQTQSLGGYLGDLFLTFFSTRYSLFLFSPFLVFAVPGLRAAWRGSDAWVRAGGLAALAYVLVTVRLNRHGGGHPLNYRYPLEPLVLAAPLLVLAITGWYERVRPIWQRVFWYSVVVSVAAQAVARYAQQPNYEIGFLLEQGPLAGIL